MELGYALGRRRRFIVSAQVGTKLPFDEDKLPTRFWADSDPDDARRQSYTDWLDRYAELPPSWSNCSCARLWVDIWGHLDLRCRACGLFRCIRAT